MDYSIVPGSVRHIKPMASRMRAAACITLQDYGYLPRAALHRVFVRSLYCRAALVDGRPVAMWGVVGTLLNETAYVWLVMSDEIAHIPRTIVREAKRELAGIMKGYREIAATVLPDDDAAIRFAVYLGFHDRDDEADDGTRKATAREIRENPRHRIPVGDQFVIGLGYHSEAH